MFTQRSLTGRIKGLRYAIGPNDFKFAQRLRTALVRAILDRSPVGPAEPVSTAETHRLMLAADRASARIAKWEKQPEPDPRPIAFWPADFVEGDQFLAPALCKTENRFSELVGAPTGTRHSPKFRAPRKAVDALFPEGRAFRTSRPADKASA